MFTVGTPTASEEKFAITIPCLLSFLGTGSVDGEVQGINPLREQYVAQYGDDPTSKAFTAGDYTPIIPVTYWSLPLHDGPRLLMRGRRCGARSCG